MAVRFAVMSSPHSLFNGESKDIGCRGVASRMQRDPGKVRKFAAIRLWINRPLVSSPEPINANDRLKRWRGGGNGVDVGTQHYESKLPLVGGCPTGINEMR